MSEKEDESSKPSTLEDLDKRLRLARGRERAPHSADQRGSALGLGFRVATELVASVVVGGVIGWALDAWLGTTPWFLLIFFFLGVIAGILGVVRTAQEMNLQQVSDDEVVGDEEDDT